jgi:hypothetical protein
MQKHDYYMNGQQLEKSEEERDIGVMITSNLKPSAQCAKAGSPGTDHQGLPLQR